MQKIIAKLSTFNLQLVTLLALLFSFSPPPLRAADLLSPGFEPYGSVSWTGINGAADLGVGANLTFALTKSLSLVTFGEADNTTGGFVDRFGAGLRYTAQLGKSVSLDAGVAGAYDLEQEHFFLRLPLGANLYAFKSKSADVGMRVQYAFDISGDGPNGSATGRLFAGPVVNLRF
jgi:hypothetical protein